MRRPGFRREAWSGGALISFEIAWVGVERSSQMALPACAIWKIGTDASQSGTERRCAGWQSHRMAYLPSLYKAHGVPVKGAVCAICLDRTRGRTLERQLTHGVRIW